MPEPILKVRDLHKSFGDLHVLKGVSFDVYERDRVAILGFSGSGKSTLLRCLTRLVEPDKGDIWIDGIHVTSPNAPLDKIRKITAYVFQRFNLWPHLRVIDNVTLALRIVHGIPKEEAEKIAEKVLRRVGLEDKMYNYPGELSGGQQQRVAIARALAINPKIIFLDEPTSALDPDLIAEVLSILDDLAKEGRTMVIVTHELDFVQDAANRVMFLYNGKIVEEGPTEEVLSKPKHPAFRRYLRRLLHRLEKPI